LVPNDFPINYYLILAERLDDDGEVIDDVLIHAYIKVGDYYLDSEGFHTIDDIDNENILNGVYVASSELGINFNKLFH
jgi:hypothetical protein